MNFKDFHEELKKANAMSVDLKYTNPREDNPQQPRAKQSRGKHQWSLLDYNALEGLVKVREYGALVKYKDFPRDSWKHIENAQAEYKEALMRHVVEYFKGNILDEESGLPHLDHAMCNIMFLNALMKEKAGD